MKTNKFKHFETAIKAFIGYIELKLNECDESLPVFLLNTGDDSYYLNSKYKKTDEKEVYQKIPRFIISIDDFQTVDDENSGFSNTIDYFQDNQVYNATYRLKPLIFQINSDYICQNILKYFEASEIMLSILSFDNSFTYEYNGITYDATFYGSTFSTEKNSMEMSSGTKNISLKSGIELKIYPAILKVSSIRKYDDITGFETRFNINVNGGDEVYKTELNIDK